MSLPGDDETEHLSINPDHQNSPFYPFVPLVRRPTRVVLAAVRRRGDGEAVILSQDARM